MDTSAADVRRQRGLEIAATARIVRKGASFTVPSQTLTGNYTVIKAHDEFHCSCPDYELRGQTCKHGFAAEFFLKREVAYDGTVTETRAVRVTYGQDWSSYNKAQVTEKATFLALLKDLVSSVETPTQKRGRPALPLSDMIFAAAFKVYSLRSARRFMTDLSEAQANGMIERTPHFNSVLNCLEKESLTPILERLIAQSAAPLSAVETDFAVDSTGFGTSRFYRHFIAKYGKDQVSRDYVKLHAAVGVKTNVITAAIATDRDTHDSPMLAPLMETTAQNFNVERVAADKAYSSHKNLEMIEAMGATALVPFKSNAVGTSASPTWNRLFHFFHLHREEFVAAYHCRSNAESAFSAIKRKFGHDVRAKTLTAQRNEALMKILCHNIVCVAQAMAESVIAQQIVGLHNNQGAR